jgi:diguanylate cyclase (GGDEF)-like protein
MLDLDNFKEYNDTFGHPRGDEVLAKTAKILENNIRNHDIVARYGGDEFSVILIDADEDKGLKIGGRICESICNYSFEDEARLKAPVTISVGVAVYPENSDSSSNLVDKADQALYEAKSQNKNCVKSYRSVLQDLKDDLGESQPKLVDKVETLISIIDNRDKYTYAHSERVGKLSIALGKKMGLSGEEIQSLKYASFLHDLGKVEIDTKILNKPGKLNEEEQETVKQIPVYSKNIIEEVDLEKVISAVLHQRERYDGEGYPYGLAKEEIPFLARVLALVDSFDAMLSTRPYREPLSLEEAKEELMEGSGRQFDPEIVDAFLDLIFEGDRLPVKYRKEETVD